jgi:hypothetical protein
VVKTFLDDGGSLTNATKTQMESGFGWAWSGRNEVVEFLLDRGVDLRAGEKQPNWPALGGDWPTAGYRQAASQAGRAIGSQERTRTALGQATWCVINGDRSADYTPIISALLDAGARLRRPITDRKRERRRPTPPPP